MLSNSSCFPRNWNCSMSQATWPPSAMIFISFIGAINPFFCSSKSLVSENGSLAFAFLRISIVNFEGALPFGWKCPFNGLAGCGRADSSCSGIWLALFFMAFSFFAGSGVLTADKKTKRHEKQSQPDSRTGAVRASAASQAVEGTFPPEGQGPFKIHNRASQEGKSQAAVFRHERFR